MNDTQTSYLPISTDARENYGCLLDTVDLSCAQNTEIAITGAKYGKYFNACSECCTPSSNDCFETMADNSPAKWEALKVLGLRLN